MGQGINTKAVQTASRVLGVPMSSIFIKETCTGNVPNAAPSAASFGTDAVCMAVKVPAEIIRLRCVYVFKTSNMHLTNLHPSSQDACEKLMRRLHPLMERTPRNSWQQWVCEAYFEKISLSATGFFMCVLLLKLCYSESFQLHVCVK